MSPPEPGAGVRVFGRQSSHYARMVRIVAEELDVAYTLLPIFDLMSEDAATFGGNPALKLPVVQIGDAVYFGSLNGCRAVARAVGRSDAIVWPEDSDSALLMNAHEVVANAMAAEVDVVTHEVIAQRPPDRASCKRRLSLENCVAWLDDELPAIRSALPEGRLSLFEVSLYCLLAHFPFRNPIDLSSHTNLLDFERQFGARPSALATPYCFDSPP